MAYLIVSTRSIAGRFRGFLPVAVDIETGGFDADTDALLEIAGVILTWNEDDGWCREQTIANHVQPFEGSNLDEAALKFNKIDPYHPFRMAVNESDALGKLFKAVRAKVAEHNCTRAIMVGHNPAFDLAFLSAATKRTGIKKNPFHAFSTFDTAALAGVALGQTVLARSVQAAGIEWDEECAHSAVYDAEKTADLFCWIVNRWDALAADEM